MSIDLRNISLSNAAGRVKTRQDFMQLCKAQTTRRLIGSITKEYCAGNIPVSGGGGTCYFDRETRTSYNALGLPNPGLKATLAWIREAKKICDDDGVELAVSVAAFSPEESAELCGAVRPYVHRVEWNGGCPNSYGKDGAQKLIPTRHPELLHETLFLIRQEIGGENVSIKGSPIDPISELALLEKIGFIIAESGCGDEFIGSNTIPGQSGTTDTGQPALSFKTREDAEETLHTGGKAGRPLKPISLRMLMVLRELLPRNIQTTGCGGIFEGGDLLEYLRSDVSGVQIGTAFFEEGPRIFSDVMGEADTLLETQSV